jgi:hypothetical protein
MRIRTGNNRGIRRPKPSPNHHPPQNIVGGEGKRGRFENGQYKRTTGEDPLAGEGERLTDDRTLPVEEENSRAAER